MRDHYDYAHFMMGKIKNLPEVHAWRVEQIAKIAELQQGTWRERKGKDGNPVAKPPFGGPENWFEYRIVDTGISTEIAIRCNQTGDEISLDGGPA